MTISIDNIYTSIYFLLTKSQIGTYPKTNFPISTSRIQGFSKILKHIYEHFISQTTA